MRTLGDIRLLIYCRGPPPLSLRLGRRPGSVLLSGLLPPFDTPPFQQHPCRAGKDGPRFLCPLPPPSGSPGQRGGARATDHCAGSLAHPLGPACGLFSPAKAASTPHPPWWGLSRCRGPPPFRCGDGHAPGALRPVVGGHPALLPTSPPARACAPTQPAPPLSHADRAKIRHAPRPPRWGRAPSRTDALQLTAQRPLVVPIAGDSASLSGDRRARGLIGLRKARLHTRAAVQERV